MALLAPHLFAGFWEYQISLWGTALLLFLVLIREKESWLYRSKFEAPLLVVGAGGMLPAFVGLSIGVKHAAYDSLAIITVLLFVLAFAPSKNPGVNPTRGQAAPACCGVALLIFGAVLFASARGRIQNSASLRQNFYGELAVHLRNAGDPNWEEYEFRNG